MYVCMCVCVCVYVRSVTRVQKSQTRHNIVTVSYENIVSWTVFDDVCCYTTALTNLQCFTTDSCMDDNLNCCYMSHIHSSRLPLLFRGVQYKFLVSHARCVLDQLTASYETSHPRFVFAIRALAPAVAADNWLLCRRTYLPKWFQIITARCPIQTWKNLSIA
jgi:hypothetical protein